VERHFHFLKDPLFVDALLVKKPERLDALGTVWLGACLLSSLAERRLRRSGMPLPSPSRRVLTRPTGHARIRHWPGVHLARDATTGARVIALPAIYHPTLPAILEALHMPPTVLTEPPVRAGPLSLPPEKIPVMPGFGCEKRVVTGHAGIGNGALACIHFGTEHLRS
jgi:hypothetical protein